VCLPYQNFKRNSKHCVVYMYVNRRKLNSPWPKYTFYQNCQKSCARRVITDQCLNRTPTVSSENDSTGGENRFCKERDLSLAQSRNVFRQVANCTPRRFCSYTMRKDLRLREFRLKRHSIFFCGKIPVNWRSATGLNFENSPKDAQPFAENSLWSQTLYFTPMALEIIQTIRPCSPLKRPSNLVRKEATHTSRRLVPSERKANVALWQISLNQCVNRRLWTL
jgi:hypothetical protein